MIEKLENKKILIGFDGFIDVIYRVIKDKNSLNEEKWFNTINEFGNYTVNKSNSSFNLNINKVVTKIGGNAPILANALSNVGFKPTCIGAFGEYDIEHVFNEIHNNCHLVSVCNPGMCYALEFTDGKIMLGDNNDIDKLSWDLLIEKIGMDKILDYFINYDLISILNWGEIDGIHTIYEGISKEILPNIQKDKTKTIFCDLSDFSYKDKSKILELLKIFDKINQKFNVVLSVNTNESMLLYKAIFDENLIISEQTDVCMFIQEIFKKINVDQLILHDKNMSVVVDDKGYISYNNDPITPKISTGGGDNFNSGYCTGILLGYEKEDCLRMGVMSGNYYVENGNSIDLEKLLNLVKESYNA